jgi:TM2 domain-containing membrane protein YozV
LWPTILKEKASMKKSTKAVMLTAFIFPGAGHIYLKKYISGIVLMGVSFAGVCYLISRIVERALQIVEKIQYGHGQADTALINQLLSAQSTGNESLLTNMATIAIIACWIISTIDAYRIARTQTKTRFN